MKTKKKSAVLIVCAALALAAVLAAVLLSKLYVPHAREYAAQFNAVRAEYDAAAAYLQTLTKKEPAAPVTVSIPTVGDENTIYFFRDDGGQRVKTVSVDPQEMMHLNAVAAAFASIGFELKTMRVQGGTVRFTAKDDAYQVLYLAADEKPEAPNGRAVRLDACWYQIIAD